MAFDSSFLTIVGLLKLELPGTTVRLCDGGLCSFGGEVYKAEDPLFGVIDGIDPIDEGVGDLAPGGSITFLPAPDASAATLMSPSYQNARLRGWLGEIGSDLYTVTSAEPLFDGLVDVPTIKLAKGVLSLALAYMSRAEKLFLTNRGNTLSPRFHKSIWAGELGFDNANGAEVSVAWGVESAGGDRGTVSVGNQGFVGSVGQQGLPALPGLSGFGDQPYIPPIDVGVFDR